MAFASLRHGGTPGGRKLLMFEIRPEQEFIVFRGPPGETPDSSLKGTVVLMTSESMQVKGGIKVIFEGRRRTQHFITRPEAHNGLSASTVVLSKDTFIHQEIRLTDSRGQPLRQLSAGNHEFSFAFHLPGDIDESIEGLSGNHITYDLKAVCERGVLTKDMSTRKHVRIIRTIGPDALESGATSAVHGVWPDKIKYLFEPVSKNFIFGTILSTDLELVPLIEKLSIEKIRFTLKETRKIKTDPGPDYSPTTGRHHGMWKEEQDVFQDSMLLPPNCEDTDADTQLPMFKFRANWLLPKSLARCRQTVNEGDWIQIQHHAHYDILLRNPDGHLSELKAHHPVRLFISPNLPIDDTSNMVVTPPEVAGESNDPMDNSAPPIYGSHQLDMLVPLYEGIDASGYITPGPNSGGVTPFRYHSRNASSENLSTSAESSNGHPNPNILSSRLRNLQMTEDRSRNRANLAPLVRHTSEDTLTPQRSHSSERERHHSSSTTPQYARSKSIPTIFHQDEEEHLDYDMNALGRMPSYNTAVKSAGHVSRREAPPTYATAISRPSSPRLQPPTRAHVRTNQSSRGGTP